MITDNTDSLKAVVNSIIRRGKMKGYDTTIEEIAKKAEIPANRLIAFLNGEKIIPKDFTSMLLTTYNITFTIVQDIRYQNIKKPEDEKDEIDE